MGEEVRVVCNAMGCPPRACHRERYSLRVIDGVGDAEKISGDVVVCVGGGR